MTMTMRRRWAVFVALVAALVPSASALGADDPETIVGSNGRVYPAAPAVVQGTNGELFWGRSFDLFCADGSGNFAHSFDQLAKLAKVIRASGRRVVFTVAPDKAHVSGERIDRSTLPHGRCDRRGIRAHGKILSSAGDPSFLAVTPILDHDPRKVFWKTDTHWTTVGAAVFAKALATTLDPELGKRQTFTPGKKVAAVGPLAASLGSTKKEIVPTAVPAGGISVKVAAHSPDLGDGDYIVEHVWTSRPAARTWPGRTLVLGDSFSYIALENLRPVFNHGHFLWVGHHDQAKINRAIIKSDTVVLEVAQFFLTVSQLTQDSFRRSVRSALRQNGSHRE
jgi:hypothetical protein